MESGVVVMLEFPSIVHMETPLSKFRQILNPLMPLSALWLLLHVNGVSSSPFLSLVCEDILNL
jgi:hypothetical protein